MSFLTQDVTPDSSNGKNMFLKSLLPCTKAIHQQISASLQAPCGKVLVIGLFDGIAGLLAAVSRIPVTIMGFVSSEVDPLCKKVVRKRWPGVIELGSVEDIDFDAIGKLAKNLC